MIFMITFVLVTVGIVVLTLTLARKFILLLFVIHSNELLIINRKFKINYQFIIFYMPSLLPKLDA